MELSRDKIKEIINDDWLLMDDCEGNKNCDVVKEMARIALASLEAEPVAYIFKHPAGRLFWSLTDESNKGQSDVMPVYTASPAPMLPEEMPKGLAGQIVSLLAHNIGDKLLAQKIWNACRAAMLQGVK